MEVVRERRGRVAAGKHVSRPVTVHCRTLPILTQEQEEALRSLLWVALMVALALLGSWLEGSTWPA